MSEWKCHRWNIAGYNENDLKLLNAVNSIENRFCSFISAPIFTGNAIFNGDVTVLGNFSATGVHFQPHVETDKADIVPGEFAILITGGKRYLAWKDAVGDTYVVEATLMP